MSQESFRRTDEWKFDALSGSVRPEIDRRYETGHVQIKDGRRWHSFSGHERNHLFVNQQGQAFHDQSPLSGLDNIADGRSFARWDFDRDGWQDIALVNANFPLLNIYRNELGSSQVAPKMGKFIAVRLVGGNRAGRPSTEFSNRDAVGAEIQLMLSHTMIRRELRCGEGFAAQNSNSILIGIGTQQKATDLTVHWPSGRITRVGDIEAGQLVTVFEDVSETDARRGFHFEPYRAPPINFEHREQATRLVVPLAQANSESAKLRLITTMATWCAACKKHLPQLAHLRATFPENLALFGVPADPIDSRKELDAYVKKFKPAYRLIDVRPDELESLQQIFQSSIRTDSLPATLVTDRRGNLLQAFEGVPTASEIAKLMAEQR